MSWVRNLAAFVVAITAFAIGSVAANFAFQVMAFSGQMEPAPEETKVWTLVSKGPGTKAHLELTNFKFGEPFIDKTGEKWDYVWVPLLPPSGKTANPAVFFRSTRIKNQAQLDEFREQMTLRVMVINTALKRSVWGSGGISKDLYLKYANIDFDKLTLVAEPDFEVPYARELTGKTIVLPTETLMSATTKNAAWAVGAGSILIGILLVVLMITPANRVNVTDARCGHDRTETGTSVTQRYVSAIPARYVKLEDVKNQRERLVTENPVTSHQFRPGGMIGSTLGIGLSLLAFLGVFGALVYGTSRFNESGPAAAAGVGFIAASVFMFIVYLSKRSMDLNGKYADVIQICNTGIRWQLGKVVRMAAWSELAYVERYILDVNHRKQVMAAQFGLVGALAASMGSAGDESQLTRQRDTVTIQLHSGEVMYFSLGGLSEYNFFAETIHGMHGNEARRWEGGAGDGMFGRAFMVPGGKSRATMFSDNR